jgi:hypothetical protein
MTAIFRTPAELVDEIGIPKTAIRRYALESGHFTRVGKNKVVMDEGHVKDLALWIRNRSNKAAEWAVEAPAADPFQ